MDGDRKKKSLHDSDSRMNEILMSDDGSLQVNKKEGRERAQCSHNMENAAVVVR